MQKAIPFGDKELVYLLRRVYSFARALKVLRNSPLYTREFLIIMRSWGESHRLLKELESLGLVERYTDYCRSGRRRCVYNRVARKGEEFLELLEKIVAIIGNHNLY